MKKLFLILLIPVILSSCENDIDVAQFATSLPTVTTDTVFLVTPSTATAWSTVTDSGGDSVIARGVCWGITTNPTISGDHTTDGAGTGFFTSAITGLNPSTMYYVRAYATNSAGTSYGNERVLNAQPDIYVVGGQYGLGTIKTKATLWKNGIATLLTDGTNDASAFGGCVSGTDVYVVGYEKSGFNEVATVWKNGVPTRLSDPTHTSIAKSIAILGTDVYVVGWDKAGFNAVATVWKNGVATSLTSASNNGQAYTVFTSGTDVYIVGFEGNSSGSVGKLWKNGVVIPYGTGPLDPYGLFVSGPDVYVAGVSYLGGKYYATVWKNGVPTLLSGGLGGDARARSVVVSGTDVYVAGYEDLSPGHHVGTIWKNGVVTRLTATGYDGYAEQVCVVSSDVYVAGYDYNGSSYTSAKLYKNGVTTVLPTVEVYSFVNSMFVK